MAETDIKPASSAPTAPATPATATVTFRIFAHALDLPMANALRVKLGIAKADLDRTFPEKQLQDALNALTEEA